MSATTADTTNAAPVPATAAPAPATAAPATTVAVPASPTDYVSQAISKIVLMSFEKITTSEMSVKKIIGGIAILILAEATKSVATSLVKDAVPTITTCIKISPILAYKYIKFTTRGMFALFRDRCKTTNEIDVCKEYHINIPTDPLLTLKTKTIEIVVSQTLLEKFVQYIMLHKQHILTHTFSQIDIENIECEIVLNEKDCKIVNSLLQTTKHIKNINFVIENVPMTVQNELSCTFIDGKIKDSTCELGKLPDIGINEIKQHILNDINEHEFHYPSSALFCPFASSNVYIDVTTIEFEKSDDCMKIILNIKPGIPELGTLAKSRSVVVYRSNGDKGYNILPCNMMNTTLSLVSSISYNVFSMFRSEINALMNNLPRCNAYCMKLFRFVLRYLYNTYVATPNMLENFTQMVDDFNKVHTPQKIVKENASFAQHAFVSNVYINSLPNGSNTYCKDIPVKTWHYIMQHQVLTELRNYTGYNYIDEAGRKIRISSVQKSITDNPTMNFAIYHTSIIEFNKLITASMTLIAPNTTTTSKEQKLSFSVPVETDTEKIYSKFTHALNTISKELKRGSTNKEITLNHINVKKIVDTKEIENPAYEKYTKRKQQLLEELENNTNGCEIESKFHHLKRHQRDTQQLIFEELGMPPPKITNITTTSSEIVVKSIGTRYSTFENLYLPSKQDIMLQDLLDTFCNDKIESKTLGFPNKLGICLYGPPGCGKTTLISTIASYLGLNLFYAQISGLTNDELTDVFNKVNEGSVSGGIIVIEDIDNCNPVVLTSEARTRRNITIDNTLFTFDHLLNILDGAMTADNSVVIITTNYKNDLEPSLLRPGRMDQCIELKFADHWQISKLFKRIVGRSIDTSVLHRIPEQTFSPAQFIFHLRSLFKSRHSMTDEELLEPFLKKSV